MAAQSPTAGTGSGSDPGDEPGSGDGNDNGPQGPAAEGASAASKLWHSVNLARATAMDLAVLARHLVMYPTGIFPERDEAPPQPRDAADDGPQNKGSGQKSPQNPRSEGDSPNQGQDAPPVLLLHGFVDNRSTFSTLRRSLLEHGWSRVPALNYSPLTSDIRTAAALLGQQLEQICEQSGREKVDIVGHSLGGLIARYYVQCLGGDRRVRTLVTLGTPHTGTRAIPALLPHPLIRQMRPGSEVLAELAGRARGCRTRFVAFWSDMDELMIPVESARLEHKDLKTKSIKVTGVGHLALPLHGEVAAEIRRTLAGEGPLPHAIDAA